MFDPVVKQATDIARQSHQPLTLLLVFNWGLGVGPMNDFECLLSGVVVGNVECERSTDAHLRVPEKRQQHAWSGRALVGAEVLENRVGPLAVEHHIPNVVGT